MKNRLTPEDIEQINKNCPSEWEIDSQGIFVEPYGVPEKYRGQQLVYMRWSPGGISGGSCREDSDPQPYSNSNSKPSFTCLDMVLRVIYPEISYLEYKEIESKIINSEETDYEYYGNCTEYEMIFIPLETIYKILKM